MNNATTTRDDLEICSIQDALLSMPIGTTGVRFGVVVTRWGKDGFEVGTWGRGDVVGSESAAEAIVAR
jgi:hypothetical protein